MRSSRAITCAIAIVVGSLTAIGTASPAAASTPVVTPRHGLPYYARVAIHAEKWAHTEYTVSECFDTPAGEYCAQVGSGFVPANGVLDTSVVLTRKYDFGDGRQLDCAVPDAACEIVVDAQPVPSRQSLTFDPSAPVPLLHVTPNTGLGWRQPVTVTGSGYLPNQFLWVTQCVQVTDPRSFVIQRTPCIGAKHQPQPTVNGDGRFTFTLDARRMVGEDDCVTNTNHCFIRALIPDERYHLGPVDTQFAVADDGRPVVLLDAGTSVTESAGTTHIEVRLTDPATAPLTVSYTTAASPPSDLYDPARPGADYVTRTSRLQFLPGESRHVIAIPIVDDEGRENGEAFDVQISGRFHALRRTSTVFISDND